MIRIFPPILLAGAAWAFASAACAGTAPGTAELFAAVRSAPPATAPLIGAPAAFDPDAQALKAAGVAKTGVDHRFAGRSLVGSVGLLCGLQPTPDAKGGMTAYGVDDQGRFLGGKLHFAFR